MAKKSSHATSPIIVGGDYHNLTLLFNSVNAEEFEGQVRAKIIWGNKPTRHAEFRKSIRFGTYTDEGRLIRIHPFLDQAFVPTFFVRYIVFHEMLHEHIGMTISPAGYHCWHTPKFKFLERAYCDYDRAVAWHDDPENLAKLLAPHRKIVS